MEQSILQGKLRQMRGQLKQEWGRLSDSQLDAVNGRYDHLVGLLQETYGYTAQKAQEQLDQFIKRTEGESTQD